MDFFVTEGAHVMDTSKRVFIDREPMNLTLCGLMLSQGEMFTNQQVYFVASMATVRKGSYCEACKVVGADREKIMKRVMV